jgi:hypothetical protein
MYLSRKSAFVRNIGVASVNGTVTLIILLIAPLGLAAVIVNVFLITVSTFFISTAADWVMIWLLHQGNDPKLNGLYRDRRVNYLKDTKSIKKHE